MSTLIDSTQSKREKSKKIATPLSAVVELHNMINTKHESDWTTIDWVHSHTSQCTSAKSSLRNVHHHPNHRIHHHHYNHHNSINHHHGQEPQEMEREEVSTAINVFSENNNNTSHKHNDGSNKQEDLKEEEEQEMQDLSTRPTQAAHALHCNSKNANNEHKNKKEKESGMLTGKLIPYGESFLVALLCGLILGLLGVFTDACSHWVSAFRIGICANFFWLSENVCCFGGVDCKEYYTWGEFFLGRGDRVIGFVNVIMYITLSTLAAVVASMLCRSFAPFAAGGGIAEVKTIVSGHHVRRYLGGWTLFIKTIAMCLSTGSGLVIGKEGPFVHIGACVGGIAASLLPSYQLNEVVKRELITAGAGGGMAVAFGAPVGGVIFALEEVSTIYNYKALMTTLIMGVTAVLLQAHIDLWHTGQIVQFSVNYKHAWHLFELPLFALLGCFGGFVGALFNVVNLRIARWRKKVKMQQWRVCEVAVLASCTALINFITPYSSGSLLELLSDCFQDCIPGSVIEMCEDSEWYTLASLITAGSVKLMLFMITVGCFLPAGVLVPSLTIGALYGRAFGITLREVQERFRSSSLFVECTDQDLCVIPGLYAIIGAAAVLTGVTRMTICLAIIMFELTGSLDYMVPVIIGIVCSKAAAEAVGTDGCYEITIEEAQLPYLDPKKEFQLNYVAMDVCAGKQFSVLTSCGLTLYDINERIKQMNVKGFPVVESNSDLTLLGYAPTKSIVNAIQTAVATSKVTLTELCEHKEGLEHRSHGVSTLHNTDIKQTKTKSLSINTLVRFKEQIRSRTYNSNNNHLSDNSIHHSIYGDSKSNDNHEELCDNDNNKNNEYVEELDLSEVVECCMIQVEPSCPVRTLLYLFKSLGTHYVMICEHSKFVGIISKKDLIAFMRAKEKEEQVEDAELVNNSEEERILN